MNIFIVSTYYSGGAGFEKHIVKANNKQEAMQIAKENGAYISQFSK